MHLFVTERKAPAMLAVLKHEVWCQFNQKDGEEEEEEEEEDETIKIHYMQIHIK